jgi:hypothetical protein
MKNPRIKIMERTMMPINVISVRKEIESTGQALKYSY